MRLIQHIQFITVNFVKFLVKSSDLIDVYYMTRETILGIKLLLIIFLL